MDFKTDGKFIITSGGITQGIAKELNLGKNDCKKLGSIWNEIIKELNDPNNFKVANNKNKIPDKNNGFTVYKDAIVEFCKESWARIVNLVNTALNKNIEISDENKAEQPVNQPDNMSKAPTKKLPEIVSNPELDNWFLDAKNYVVGSPTSTEDITEIFEQQPKMITDWYDNYKKDYGEMNFPTAVKYLNDNPDLPEEIQEYIKTAFGICDGDITKNKQGSKGTCHLLSCKAELEACEQLQDIVDNIVVQNEDGTVTVTLFGAEDEDGNPFKVTLTNKEIRDSYKYDTWPKHTHSSSDPDAAALEIAYQKLISNLSKQYEELEQKENEIMNKQFIATVKNTLNKLNSIETTDENLLKIKEYLNNNAEVFNKDNPADILKKWEDDGILKDLYKCEILDPNCEEYNNLSIERSAIYKPPQQR